MLVTQRSSWGGVSEPAHQFGEGGPGLGGEDGSGVSEVVPAQVGSSGCLAGRIVDAVERRWGDVGATVGGGEQQGVSASHGQAVEVLFEHRDEVRRDGDISGAGVALGCADESLSGGSGDAAADVDDAVLQVEVASAELGDLSEPECAPRGE